jgi:hypothetical protein
MAMEESSSGSNRNSQEQKEMIHTQKYLGFSGEACGIGDHFYRERGDFVKIALRAQLEVGTDIFRQSIAESDDV